MRDGNSAGFPVGFSSGELVSCVLLPAGHGACKRQASLTLPAQGGRREGDAGTLLPWPPQRNLRALHSELTWLWPAVISTQDVTWATEGEEGR